MIVETRVQPEMKDTISPSLSDLGRECVLVQAWKKSIQYIRSHNWYADHLELDLTALSLPSFIEELSVVVQSRKLTSNALRMVPAPKSHRWRYKAKFENENEIWETTDLTIKKLRPLAHVSVRDQVLATAMMLCLADRVETRQGNPKLPINFEQYRSQVVNYGHRLFCDSYGTQQKHRWGSTKLYRQYYEDFVKFNERPNLVLQEHSSDIKFDTAIIQCDLSKFYDRVSPQLLHKKVRALQDTPAEDSFFDLFEKLFNWSWDDEALAKQYAEENNIAGGYLNVSLPQGLVASGFFANVVLLDFDRALISSFGKEIADGVVLLDACRYVDDIKLVVQLKKGIRESDAQALVLPWLNTSLTESAPGLVFNMEKTKTTIAGREDRFLVKQSETANRIQRRVSGGFDVALGTDLIGAIEGFFHTQVRFDSDGDEGNDRKTKFMLGTTDMRDDTAKRFAAGKFRRVFRSLRPLLESNNVGFSSKDVDFDEDPDVTPSTAVNLSKQEMDEKAHLFASMLIESWVENPSNVRLLRVALDMVPDEQYLTKVLELLRGVWSVPARDRSQRDVALYCLAELFRAGATETGMVGDNDCLPKGADLGKYQELLLKEANSVLDCHATMPWYVLQQVALFVCAQNDLPTIEKISLCDSTSLLQHKLLARYLLDPYSIAQEQIPAFYVIAKNAFGISSTANQLSSRLISQKLFKSIIQISPQSAAYLYRICGSANKVRLSDLAKLLGCTEPTVGAETLTLAELAIQVPNPFHYEANLLSLAKCLLNHVETGRPDFLTPWEIACKVHIADDDATYPEYQPDSFEITTAEPQSTAFFKAPDGCDSEDRLKFTVGQLLRFALTGTLDNRRNEATDGGTYKIGRYRPPTSHWEQYRYGSYFGRSTFGSDWLPMSSWSESLLIELLQWPGCANKGQKRLIDIAIEVDERLLKLRRHYGKASKLMFLEQRAPYPGKAPAKWNRSLRVGIVQSIVPDMGIFKAHADQPELNDPAIRNQHRSHLSAILEGVKQMLRIRDTHRSQKEGEFGTIDLLVFPELSVHPSDINAVLLPFVRSRRCIVLAGLVYHKHESGDLINSALWLIPEWSEAHGLQIRRIEQGKAYLTKEELMLTPCPAPFRPAQWIIEFPWSSDSQADVLRISASVCFDATDLRLISDLKTRSDIFIVCALNKDVATFDRMAEGLHYHMYQGVLVVNNGEFGGSSFYLPYCDLHNRQVLHLHGQPQAQIAFVEISPEKMLSRPTSEGFADQYPAGKWKSTPAGWKIRE